MSAKELAEIISCKLNPRVLKRGEISATLKIITDEGIRIGGGN